MESSSVGQQASSEPKESGSQPRAQAIPPAPSEPSQKADVPPGDQGYVKVSEDAPPTKTENPSERQQAPTEAPSGHTATAPHLSSDYPNSDHDSEKHASHAKDNPHIDDGEKKGSDKQD